MRRSTFALGWLILATCGSAFATIAMPNSVLAEEPVPQWIWTADSATLPEPKGSAFLRATFDLTAADTKAVIDITADDEFELYVNARRVGRGQNWQELQRFQIGNLLRVGKNAVCILATNAGGQAACVASIKLETPGGTTSVVTGPLWKASSRGQQKWLEVGFDDSNWPAPHVFGPLGTTSPWGAVTAIAERQTPQFKIIERPAGPFQFVNNDRCVFIGDTLIERMQANDDLETELTRRHPQTNITFRNLGWSADTPFGESRSGFGTVVDGTEQLREQIYAAQPSVAILGYGNAASFAGAEGLPEFERGIHQLLDMLEVTAAAVIVLSPTPYFAVEPWSALAAPQNENRKLYAESLKNIANQRGAMYVDLLSEYPRIWGPVAGPSNNGIHLTENGYRQFALLVADALTPVPGSFPTANVPAALDPPPAKKLGYFPRSLFLSCFGEERFDIKLLEDTSLRAESLLARLPALPGTVPGPELSGQAGKPVNPNDAPPTAVGNTAPMVKPFLMRPILGVTFERKPANYCLKIDDEIVVTATAEEWRNGVRLPAAGPEFDQLFRLQAAIRRKNELFFHRWRPQNETYLFGFRKHEQGQNAREIPMFDPLVEEVEKEIARLRVPVPHIYEIVRQPD